MRLDGLLPRAVWAGSPVSCLLVLAPAAAWAQGMTATLPRDLSAWGMVANADWVIRSVMALLALASVLTWTVALAKAAELLRAGRRIRAAVTALRSATSLQDATARLGPGGSPCAALVSAAQAEWTASGGLDKGGVKERAAWQLERLVAARSRRLGGGIGLLATIGAVGPFVGLFGTVWGIMDSFVGIAQLHTTNLAVVAPGIAQALLATAFGLAAAIPAVVTYNLCTRAVAGQRAGLADAAAEAMRLLSRDLDRGTVFHARAVAE